MNDLFQHLIAIQGLTHSYANETPSLRGVDLSIAQGESVALVGPNGAGKTSLFLCLAGLVSFQARAFRIGEIDALKGDHRKKLAAKAALLFQDSDDQLLCPTVEEDVAFGPLNHGATREEARDRAREALALVGLEQILDRVPHKLSGGEKRRVALAGLLAMNPDILLLDEPSQFLDHRSRRTLIRILKENTHSKLIATHDFELALEICQRVILLDQGLVVADGPIRDIFSNKELLEKYGLEPPPSLINHLPGTAT